jgi:hypothetical protein
MTKLAAYKLDQKLTQLLVLKAAHKNIATILSDSDEKAYLIEAMSNVNLAIVKLKKALND